MQDAAATEAEQAELIKEYSGSVGRDVCLCPGFMCDNGRNIHAGDQFLANYNVTILDIMPVHIGDFVMIGPNTLITTVNRPITPKGRREHLGIGACHHRKRCCDCRRGCGNKECAGRGYAGLVFERYGSRTSCAYRNESAEVLF